MNGGRLLTAGLTEPRRSDPTAPATTARRDRDGWRIDGGKELVPAAQVAHTMLFPPVDDADVGLFLVDLNAEVSTFGPRDDHGEPQADVFLNGAAVSGRTDFPATAPR